jgi:hypothetical protein
LIRHRRQAATLPPPVSSTARKGRCQTAPCCSSALKPHRHVPAHPVFLSSQQMLECAPLNCGRCQCQADDTYTLTLHRSDCVLLAMLGRTLRCMRAAKALPLQARRRFRPRRTARRRARRTPARALRAAARQLHPCQVRIVATASLWQESAGHKIL